MLSFCGRRSACRQVGGRGPQKGRTDHSGAMGTRGLRTETSVLSAGATILRQRRRQRRRPAGRHQGGAAAGQASVPA